MAPQQRQAIYSL